MKKEKIEQAAKEANAYGYPNFNGEKHEAFNDGFLAGANFVNEKQPYSREDMIDFADKLLIRLGHKTQRFVINANIKLWEETK